jgi:23S rRNA pseudouridine2605 synthase
VQKKNTGKTFTNDADNSSAKKSIKKDSTSSRPKKKFTGTANDAATKKTVAAAPKRKHPGDFKKGNPAAAKSSLTTKVIEEQLKYKIKSPSKFADSDAKTKVDGVFHAKKNELKKGPKKGSDDYGRKDNRREDDVFSEDQIFSNEFRLNKFLSHAGIASRRKADQLIKEGKVRVNGEVVTEMGYKVKATDKIEFDGKKLSLERKYYLLLNKPKDYITTLSDEHNRRTVMELLKGAYQQILSPVKPRLYPVGRLDRNTTGVLLLTNDGELAQKLTHPSSEIQKVYHVVLDKKLRKEDFDKIAEGGVVLEDGIAEVDEIAYPNPKDRAEVGIQIHTGKNRFIRRLFEALGYEVVKLDRVFFAGLTKKDLPRSRWRFLTEAEVRNLKHFTKA